MTACTCSMIRRLSRHVTRIYDEHLEPSGLRLTQYAVLAKLHRMGPCSLVALARESDLDVTSMSRAMRPLITAGLVKCGAGPDARTKSFALTASGERTYERARKQWQQAQSAVQNVLTPSRIRELSALADSLAGAGAR